MKKSLDIQRRRIENLRLRLIQDESKRLIYR